MSDLSSSSSSFSSSSSSENVILGDNIIDNNLFVGLTGWLTTGGGFSTEDNSLLVDWSTGSLIKKIYQQPFDETGYYKLTLEFTASGSDSLTVVIGNQAFAVESGSPRTFGINITNVSDTFSLIFANTVSSGESELSGLSLRLARMESSSEAYSSSSSSISSQSSSSITSAKSSSSSLTSSLSSVSSVSSSLSSSENATFAIGFRFNAVTDKSVKALACYGSQVFAAYAGDTTIQKLSSGAWTDLYDTGLNISCLAAVSDGLYIGTDGPEYAKLYYFDIPSETLSLLFTAKMGSKFVGVFVDGVVIYAATNSGSVYRYNGSNWSLLYQASFTTSCIAYDGSNIYLGGSFVSFLKIGSKTGLAEISTESVNISGTISSNFLPGSIFDYDTKTMIDRSKMVDSASVFARPVNPETGIADMIWDPSSSSLFILGETGRVYKHTGKTLSVVFQSGVYPGRKITLCGTKVIAACGSKLFYISTNSRGDRFPIVDLSTQHVSSLCYVNGTLFFGLSDGRIMAVSEIISTACITGDRRIYAMTQDGQGVISEPVSFPVAHFVKNNVSKFTPEYDAEFNEAETPASAVLIEETDLVGVFTSPTLISNELSSWGSLSWTGSGATAYAQFSETDAFDNTWIFAGTSGSFDFSNIDPNKKYARIRMVLTGSEAELENVTLSYRGAHIVYFFTKKFSIPKGTLNCSVVLSSNESSTEENRTKVVFGIADSNTANWSLYQEVEKDGSTELADIRHIKVGAKLVSYDATNLATIDEFALVLKDKNGNTVRIS